MASFSSGFYGAIPKCMLTWCNPVTVVNIRQNVLTADEYQASDLCRIIHHLVLLSQLFNYCSKRRRSITMVQSDMLFIMTCSRWRFRINLIHAMEDDCSIEGSAG